MERRVPSIIELVVAVREFLERDVMTAVDGRVQFNARVAGNVLAMVERELRDGETIEASHQRDLQELGFDDDAALAAALRAGVADDDLLVRVVAALQRVSTGKVSIVNPRHLLGTDQTDHPKQGPMV